MFELVLALASATLIFSEYTSRRIAKKNKALIKERENLTEYVMLPSFTEEEENKEKGEHTWASPSNDLFYTSRNPMSYESVVFSVTKCEKCGIIHKYIVKGLNLARKKGFDSIEGFYYNGAKVPDFGCPRAEGGSESA